MLSVDGRLADWIRMGLNFNQLAYLYFKIKFPDFEMRLRETMIIAISKFLATYLFAVKIKKVDKVDNSFM